MLLSAIVTIAVVGCQAAPRNMPAIRAYYDYRFGDAREALRGDAETRVDEQTILNNVRLGLAALADGENAEAERALGRSFDWLSTAGLNEDRTAAAVFTHEGVRIWKGEPFEQALTYYWVAAFYATLGDWENARAASANALFRLTDFGEAESTLEIARQSVDDDDYLDEGYTAVDTNFALGFLMQAIGADLSGTAGATEQFNAAVEINEELADLVDVLRDREYDTLLMIDYGKGPTKVAYGPNESLARFAVQDSGEPAATVTRDDAIQARYRPVANVNDMARDHRWNNLEQIRRAKSLLGDALVVGGLITTQVGGQRDSGRTQLVGLGLIGMGLLTQSGARADTRYMEFAPQLVFLVPVKLDEPGTITVTVENRPGARIVLNDFEPGTTDRPRGVYLRLHGPDSRHPNWLTDNDETYGNDHIGVQPGDYPWILGGRDVSTPNRRTLEAYQANGYLTDFTLNDLLDLYEAEGIHIGSGMEDRPDEPKNPSFRHILEGGRGLFTPHPHSMGYKRLMYTPRQPYQPRSEHVRTIADSIAESNESNQETQP